jgi:hypothetical protein
MQKNKRTSASNCECARQNNLLTDEGNFNLMIDAGEADSKAYLVDKPSTKHQSQSMFAARMNKCLPVTLFSGVLRSRQLVTVACSVSMHKSPSYST